MLSCDPPHELCASGYCVRCGCCRTAAYMGAPCTRAENVVAVSHIVRSPLNRVLFSVITQQIARRAV